MGLFGCVFVSRFIVYDEVGRFAAFAPVVALSFNASLSLEVVKIWCGNKPKLSVKIDGFRKPTTPQHHNNRSAVFPLNLFNF
jgi:hypothetical protein